MRGKNGKWRLVAKEHIVFEWQFSESSLWQYSGRDSLSPRSFLSPSAWGGGSGQGAAAALPGLVPRLLIQTRVYKTLCKSYPITAPCKPFGSS